MSHSPPHLPLWLLREICVAKIVNVCKFAKKNKLIFKARDRRFYRQVQDKAIKLKVSTIWLYFNKYVQSGMIGTLVEGAIYCAPTRRWRLGCGIVLRHDQVVPFGMWGWQVMP